jgi:hypothetical protein
MNIARLTKENYNLYIGYDIIFKTRGVYCIKKILGVTNTCVKIDCPELNNCLQFSRKIYVIKNDKNKIRLIKKRDGF